MTIYSTVEKENTIDRIKQFEEKAKTQILTEMEEFLLDQLYEDLTEFNNKIDTW